MRKTLALIVVLASGSVASANESGCAAIYRQANSDYFTKISDLQTRETNLRMGGLIGLGGVAICLKKTRSIVGCGALLGPILGGSQIYREMVLTEIQKSEDAYKIYQVYIGLEREDYNSEAVQGLYTALNLKTSDERAAAQEFKRMVDSGEMCKDGAPSISWADLLKKLESGKSADAVVSENKLP